MFNSLKFCNHVKTFNRDENGSIFMLSAIGIFAIVGASAVAFDYARMVNTKSQMTNALDAAVLATGVEIMNGNKNEARLKTYFKKFYEANFNENGGFADTYRIKTFSFDEQNSKVSAEIEAELPATITGIFGHETFKVNMEANAKFDKGDVEIAMMLDVTGSMRGSKLRDLQSAAKDAIDILLPENDTKGVRIGLVPYSASVNVGWHTNTVTKGNDQIRTAGLETVRLGNETENYIRGNRVSRKDRRCVTERIGPNAATDASYKDTPVGSHKRANRFGGNCPLDSEIMPLTNQRNSLKAEINGFRASGATAGHLGVAWSYYLLSPNWKIWGPKHTAAAYDSNVQKIAILMTDGEFNTEYTGKKSDKQALALCQNMKSLKNGSPGIKIYSIAFQAPSRAQKTLHDCASNEQEGEGFYFSAANGTQLRDAFRKIAVSIQQLRISQ